MRLSEKATETIIIAYSEIHVNMLEIKKYREKKAAGQFVSLDTRNDFSANVVANKIRTFRAIRIDQRRIPNMNPLYWKCIWSTIKNPG